LGTNQHEKHELEFVTELQLLEEENFLFKGNSTAEPVYGTFELHCTCDSNIISHDICGVLRPVWRQGRIPPL
jgi:hypothetical protein